MTVQEPVLDKGSWVRPCLGNQPFAWFSMQTKRTPLSWTGWGGGGGGPLL